jgi:hypothetical protein
MKVITNEKMIKRNSRLGQIATASGLVVLIGGMAISFTKPNLAGFSWIALLVGFTLSQIGIYFGNRWGRHPRPDELLDQGLKGLNDQYSFYHYETPVAHLLVGPSGLWVILPFYQVGKIVYERNRWRQKGGGFFQRYLRAFGQEGIGRPDLEAPAEVSTLDRYIKKNIPNVATPEPNVALVFINAKAELEVENAPILTLPLKELKNTIRKSAKEKPLSPDLIKEINDLFV